MIQLRSIILGMIIGLLGCNQADTNLVDPKFLMGHWSLIRAANQEPSRLEIRTWLIDFHPDGTWAYSGELSGQFEGSGVQASGQWKLDGNTLQYTIGEIGGKSKIFQINATDIIFSPDPTIAAKGRRPVESVYRKLP